MIFDKEKNQKERMWFVDYWAEFVRTSPEEVWSGQQKEFINAVLKNVRQSTRQEYLKLKGEKFSI